MERKTESVGSCARLRRRLPLADGDGTIDLEQDKISHALPRRSSFVPYPEANHNPSKGSSKWIQLISCWYATTSLYLLLILHRNATDMRHSLGIISSTAYTQLDEQRRKQPSRESKITWEYSLSPAASPSACRRGKRSVPDSGSRCTCSRHLLIRYPVIPCEQTDQHPTNAETEWSILEHSVCFALRWIIDIWIRQQVLDSKKYLKMHP